MAAGFEGEELLAEIGTSIEQHGDADVMVKKQKERVLVRE